MNEIKDTNKYFLYARKSTESEEKQVQSLDDQIRVMKKRASDWWIKIVEIFQESMSAKAPWRYKFNEMIQRIQNWEANWIISWKLDRITRNPIDSWTIQYMLQIWKLNRIITNDREYNPVDSWLLMSVENGMANQFIIDLKKNTRRWLDSKYLKGIRPTRVPQWYYNIKENKTIGIDNDRFDLVRGMWDLMLSWNYTPPKINDIYWDKFWFRTRFSWKRWWKKLTNSWMYRIFHNIFYTGFYYHNWELIKWTHKPLITLNEFDRVQTLLWKKWQPRPKTHFFPFTWMIKCWECWCSITAEKKYKYIVSTKKTREYVYYHCTKKKRDVKCSQKVINENDLNKQILEILSEIEIIPEFKKWALEILKEEYDKDIDNILKKSESINRTIILEERKLKRWTDYLLRGVITENEYKLEKAEIKWTILKLKEERNNIDNKWNDVLDFTLEAFEFSSKAKQSFIDWDLQTKKDIFSTLGHNFILKDKKMALELNPWFEIIKRELIEKNETWIG